MGHVSKDTSMTVIAIARRKNEKFKNLKNDIKINRKIMALS
jgi:hypothetical protein